MILAHEPAFPVPMIPIGDGGYTEVRCPGMSYRQWLIGKIAEGWASAPDLPYDVSDKVCQNAARACIRIADAVIAELNEE